MILFKKSVQLSKWLEDQQSTASALGFVPTMGALHTGHLSLIQRSKELDQLTICSIFINPTQFNDTKDFDKYPVTLEADIDLLESAGCDLLFIPSVQEMYPAGTKSEEHYELGYLETVLEGKFRPGHFQGVCMIVKRLLEIIKPNRLYLGQKDYQQCMVIQKLLKITEMDAKTQLVICPTLREPGGLAMSSRNMRLNSSDRTVANCIYETLLYIKAHIQKGETVSLIEYATRKLISNGFKVDYVSISDAENLSPVEIWDGVKPIVALIAVFLSGVRLIDNLPLT